MDEGLPLLADERGYLPPDPKALRRRVFAAVSRQRAARGPAYRRRPRLVLVPVAAAAVILLLAGVRWFLGEAESVGRLVPFSGAPYFVTADGSDQLCPPDTETELTAGQVVLAVPGSGGVLTLGEIGEVRIRGAALVAIGDPDSGPALYIARGVMQIRRTGDAPLLVQAGGHLLEIRDRAEIRVVPLRPIEAYRWVEKQAASARAPRSAGFFQSANAAPEVPGLAASLDVHALQGRVVSSRMPALEPGLEISFDSRGRRGSPVRVGTEVRYDSLAGRILTLRELESHRELFDPRFPSVVAALLSAASDDDLADWKRGLALWHLAEIGQPAAIPGLTRILSKESLPVVVRAAAARGLVLLGEVDEAWKYLGTAEDAVAEALVLALHAGDREGAVGLLRELPSQADRPAFLRALAASRLRDLGQAPEAADLLAIYDSGDPSAQAIAADLLADDRDPEVTEGLARLVREGAGAERSLALDVLRKHKLGVAEGDALRILEERPAPKLHAAALLYLGRVAPEKVLPFLEAPLARGSGRVRLAALKVCSEIDVRTSLSLDRFRDRILMIGSDPETPPGEIVPAIRTFIPSLATILRLLEHESDTVREQAANKILRLEAPLQAREALIAALGDPSSGVRGTVWAALAELEPLGTLRRAREALREGSIGDPLVLDGVLRAAAQRFKDLPGVADEEIALLERLCDPSAPPRVHLMALGHLEPLIEASIDGSLDLLLQVLDRPGEDDGVRFTAASLLARASRHERGRSALRRVLASRDEPLAGAAAVGLNEQRSSGRLPEGIRDELAGSYSHPRVRAALALLPPVDVEEARALLALDLEHAIPVAILLDGLPDRVIGDLREEVRSAAESAVPAVRCLAICRLAGSRAEREFLRGRMRDADPMVRRCATGAYVLSGGELEPAELGAFLLESGETEPEKAAERALAGLRRRWNSFMRRLHDSPELVLVAHTLHRGRIDTLRLEWGRKAEKRLANESARIREEAAETLAWAGMRADVEPLIAALGDIDPGVRQTVQATIERLTGRRFRGDPAEAEGWWRERAYALPIPILRRN